MSCFCSAKPPSKGSVAPIQSAEQIRSRGQRHSESKVKVPSMDEYHKKLEAKVKSSGTVHDVLSRSFAFKL